MCGKSAYCWKTMFTGRRFAGTEVTSRPCRTIRPSSGASKPAIIRSVVVLPQPLGPSSEKNSPSAIGKLTSSTAPTPPKRLLTPSRAIATDRSSAIRRVYDRESAACGRPKLGGDRLGALQELLQLVRRDLPVAARARLRLAADDERVARACR